MKYCSILLFFLFSLRANAQLQMEAVESGKEALELLSGGSIQIESIEYFGALNAIGKFTNNNPILQINKGIYLGTGNIKGAVGPNINEGSSTNQTMNGIRVSDDKDLSRIASGKIFDLVILKFTFIPQCNEVSFQYVFGSEEYPEYVGAKFNDVFGFFISGPSLEGTKNLARLPDDSTVISINSVNMLRNSEYFVRNKPANQEALKTSLQFDGFTKKLTAKARVIPGQTYTIKIAIADVNDMIYDSGVFLEANSFNCYDAPKKDSVVATYTLHLEFPFNSAEIPVQYNRDLDSIYSAMMKDQEFILEVNGHTDNTGTPEYNKQLSLKRAEAVKTYLVNKGINASRIEAIGHGSEQPLNANLTEQEKAQNRRVVFVIKK